MNICKKNVIIIGIFLFTFMTFNSFSHSQSGRGKGRASGEVVDEFDNPVPNIKISLQFIGGLPSRAGSVQFESKDEITRETTTDKKGKWKIGGLGSGRWRVSITAEGYMPYDATIYISQFERNPYPEAFPRLPLHTVLKKVEELLAIDAPEIELFEKGNLLFKEEQYKEAITSYRAFLEKNPELYQVHFSIGNSFKEMGNTEEALKEYQIVLDNAKSDEEKDLKVKAKTLSSMAECHLKNEDLESAQEYFKESLELNPEDEILAYNVGEIYFSHQKLDEAILYFQQASQIKPEWPDAYLKLGYVYVNKADNANAIAFFEKFLELETGSERAVSVRNILDYLKK